MTKITWNAANLNQLATKIETEVGDLSNDLSTIGTICDELQSNWNGAASNKYYTTITTKKAELQTIVNSFSEAAAGLKQIAKTIEQTDADASM